MGFFLGELREGRKGEFPLKRERFSNLGIKPEGGLQKVVFRERRVRLFGTFLEVISLSSGCYGGERGCQGEFGGDDNFRTRERGREEEVT